MPVLRTSLVFILIVPCFLFISCSKPETSIDLETKAEEFVEKLMWREALACYNRILKISPGSADIHYKAALMERRLGQTDLAIRHLEKAVELDFEHSEALLELGYCYLISKRYDKAEGLVRALLEVDPENVQAKLLMGDTEALAGSFVKALERIDGLCDENPDDPLLYLRKGDLDLVLGHRTKAREAYLQALELAPELPMALMSWANFCGLMGEVTAREEALKKLSALDPDNLLYMSFLGDFYFEHGHRDKGLGVYEEAMNETSGARVNPSFMVRVIEVFLYTGKLEDAEDLISELASLRPKGVEAPYFRGHLALARGRFVDAVAAFRQAMHLSGPSDTIYFYLGLAQWLGGYVHQAQSSWQEALRLNPAFFQALLHTAALKISLGEYVMVDKALEQAFRLLPDSRDAHELFALKLLITGDDTAFENQCRILSRMGTASERLSLLKAMGHIRHSKICSTGTGSMVMPSMQRFRATMCGSGEHVGSLMGLAVAMDDKGSWVMGDNGSWIIGDGSWVMGDNGSWVMGDGSWVAGGDGAEMEDGVEWLYLKVRMAIAQGHMEVAEQGLEKLREHNSDDPAILRLAVALAELKKDHDEQIAAYRALLREASHDPEILNNLAWLLAQKDDLSALQEARFFAEKACDKESSDPALQDTRGWIYWKQGMNESAKQAWDLALSLDPGDTVVKEHLELLEHDGNHLSEKL